MGEFTVIKKLSLQSPEKWLLAAATTDAEGLIENECKKPNIFHWHARARFGGRDAKLVINFFTVSMTDVNYEVCNHHHFDVNWLLKQSLLKLKHIARHMFNYLMHIF